jgi:SPP1 gp7 family putative phage head morphogenesis protein
VSLVERMQVAAIGVVQAYTDRLMRELAPLLEERYGSRADAADVTRQDRVELGEVFDRVREGELTKPFLERMFHLVDQQAANDLQRVVPVPMKDTLPRAAELQQEWVDRNTSLIRLEQRARQEVARIVDAPIREGVRVEEIRDRIQARMNVVRSRAELIARDQTLKLYGQIQEERQTQAGIEEYTWSTSLDERVRGNPSGIYPKSHGNHWKLEGRTFRWDDPPVVDEKTGRKEHPGGDFQCRCAAIPVLSDDLEPISEVRQSVRVRGEPANDIPEELPEPGPDPVEQERQRLAEERAAREAEQARIEAERAAAEEAARLAEEQRRARAEAERRAAEERAAARVAEAARLAERARVQAAIEAQRAARAAVPQVDRFVESVKIVGRPRGAKALQAGYVRRLNELAPSPATPPLRTLEIHNKALFKLKIAGQRVEAGAYYEPGARKLVMPNKSTGTLLGEMKENVWTVVDAARTQEDALARTFTHEYGHHVHFTARAAGAPDFDARVQAAYQRLAPQAAADLEKNQARRVTSRNATEGAVSAYGTQNHAEFWAEAYAAYHHEPDWLRAQRPEVFELVQSLLKYLEDGGAGVR